LSEHLGLLPFKTQVQIFIGSNFEEFLQSEFLLADLDFCELKMLLLSPPLLCQDMDNLHSAVLGWRRKHKNSDVNLIEVRELIVLIRIAKIVDDE
jgi:hypothetical protein